MLIAAETPDASRGAALFAQIPVAMGEIESQRIFEQPLGAWLAEQGVEFSLRCFPLPAVEHIPVGIGIEVQTDDIDLIVVAVGKIAALGAPPETQIEIETDKAMIEMSLAEAAGM